MAQPSPEISILVRDGTAVEIAWDVAFEGGALEETSSLTGSIDWQTVPFQPVIRGDQMVVTLSLGDAERFFRFRLPDRPAAGFLISRHLPKGGAVEVGVTFRSQLFFSEPVDPASLDADSVSMWRGEEPWPLRIVPSNDGLFAWLFPVTPMPGGSVMEIRVVGDAIESVSGNRLDADADGEPGGLATFSFTTVGTTPLPGVELAGIIADPGPDNVPHTGDDLAPGPDGELHTDDDEILLPVEGVEVFLLGLEDRMIVTGSDGRFHFDSVPRGNVKIAVNGMTATAPPEGIYFPEMVMDAQMKVGRVNRVMAGSETVYLPRLAESILEEVSAETGMRIVASEAGSPNLSPSDREFLNIEIPANSFVGPDGAMMETARIGISTVAPELMAEMLPPGLREHTFDITVQAPKVAAFSEPAPLTMPNVFGEPPGTQLHFISFDHTTGRLVVEGTGTVAEDGLSVRTDPGVGITHPGWHGMTPPRAEIGGADGICPAPDNPDSPGDSVGLASRQAGLVGVGPLALALGAQQALDDQQKKNNCDPGDPRQVIPEPDPEWTLYLGIQPGYRLRLPMSLGNLAPPTNPAKPPDDPENSGTTPGTGFLSFAGGGNGSPGPSGNGPGGATGGQTQFLLGLIEEEVVPLFPGQRQEWFLKFAEDLCTFPAGTEPTANILHGARIELLMLESENDTPLLDAPQFYYFLCDLLDGVSGDGNWDFGEVASDGPGIVAKIHDLVLDMPETAVPEFRFQSTGTDRGTDFYWDAANGSLVFEPTSTGEATDSVELWTPEDEPRLAGSFAVTGVGVSGAAGSGSSPQTLTDRSVATLPRVTAVPDFGSTGDDAFAVTVFNNNAGGHRIGSDPMVIENAVLMENRGTRQILVTSIAMLDGGLGPFRVTGFPDDLSALNPLVIEAGASREFGFSFAAGRIGLQSAAFVVRSNTAGQTEIVRTLVGTGLPATGTALDYGSDYVHVTTPFIPDSLVFRQISDEAGNWSFLLPTDQSLVVSYFDPVSGLIAKQTSTTGSGGSTGRVLYPVFLPSRDVDTDGDGLPDDIEGVVGTSPFRLDTDQDGLGDGAEILLNLDPEDAGDRFAGFIASIDTPGNAVDVCAAGGIAAVADSATGVTIVDIADPGNPRVLAQVNTSGAARRVACAGDYVAVADGAFGLTLVDIRNPIRAAVVGEIRMPAPAVSVEAVGELAFVGLADGTVSVINLVTGVQVNRLRPGYTGLQVDDLKFTGNRLSILLLGTGRSRVLTDHVFLETGFDLGEFGPKRSVNFQAIIERNDGRLFVGTDRAYGTMRGGFQRFDLSGNQRIVRISPFESPAFGWRQVVESGAGHLLAVTGANVTSSFDVEIYRDGGLNEDPEFLARFMTPGDAQAIAVHRGMALVADGQAGLHVLNFLPFDTGIEGPTVVLNPSFDRVNPRVGESRLAFVNAFVTDDVMIRSVELFVDGRRIASDDAFPFDFSFRAPALRAGAETFTLQARAVDTGRNETWSERITVNLIADTEPPEILNIRPITRLVPDAGTFRPSVRGAEVWFSEVLDDATVLDGAFLLLSAGPDGEFGTVDDVEWTLAMILHGPENLSVSLIAASDLPVGEYRIQSETPLRDRAGNVLAPAIIGHFTVSPIVDADEDGLPDNLEPGLGLDPLRPDTDGDGILDGSEDFDADGLTNRGEVILGLDPENPDGDLDGIPDGEEDTDLDGLDDGLETQTFLDTDPFNPDTDGDGWNDETEVTAGSDPGSAGSRPSLMFLGANRAEANAPIRDLSGARRIGGVVGKPDAIINVPRRDSTGFHQAGGAIGQPPAIVTFQQE